MSVPGGSRAWLEGDCCADRWTRIFCLEERVDSNRAGKPVGRALARRSRSVSFYFHNYFPISRSTRNSRYASMSIQDEATDIEHITFSGDYAAETDQPVIYVTERCVFRRTKLGMELVEVAPGIDIERDILAHMGFKPIVNDPQSMDPRILLVEIMGLEQLLLGLSLVERISYDRLRNILFLNLEGFQVRTVEDVDLVRREMEMQCRAIGRKVALVVNYDGFHLDPVVSDAYFSMITYMQSRYYSSASRYTTSAFMRMKLGSGLAERNLKPHVFELPPRHTLSQGKRKERLRRLFRKESRSAFDGEANVQSSALRDKPSREGLPRVTGVGAPRLD